MWGKSLAALFAAALVLCSPGVSGVSTSLDVDTTSGTFRGVANATGIEHWLGIPFAEPPVGSLRFRAPLPFTKRAAAAQNASTFGNACPQAPSNSLGAPQSEDCLFLNVRVDFYVDLTYSNEAGKVFRPPNVSAASKIPVLVWIHVSLALSRSCVTF